MTIFTSLSPNLEKEDMWLALSFLVKPWRWLCGKHSSLLEEAFKSWLPCESAFSFVNGRTCLYVLLKSLDLNEDDEVLLQAYTCVVVPGAIIQSGAKPIYVDIEKGSFGMDPKDFERKITPRSRAVIIQHTFGIPANLDQLIAIARQHKLFIIEDCAHCLGATFKGKNLGTFGDASFFSFGRDKVISGIFGGMLTTNNKALNEKISNFYLQTRYPSYLWLLQQLIHPIVTLLAKASYDYFYIGKIVMVVSLRLGIISQAVTNSEKNLTEKGFQPRKMPNALASLAFFQFNKLEKLNKHRRGIVQIYKEGIKDARFLQPKTSPIAEAVFIRYPLLNLEASQVIAQARRKKINLGDWYNPVISPKGVNYSKVGYLSNSCKQSEKAAEQSLNLPTHINLKKTEALRIVEFLNAYYDSN